MLVRQAPNQLSSVSNSDVFSRLMKFMEAQACLCDIGEGGKENSQTGRGPRELEERAKSKNSSSPTGCLRMGALSS